jgi:hypothetical protein
MTLSYDFASQILTVDVVHDTVDVNSHYIQQVVILKNSASYLTRDYTSQNSTAGFTATYSVTAVHGDVISTTAHCIISGSIADDITVIDPAITTTTPPNGGTPVDMTLIIAVAIVVIGIIAVVFALLRRR